VNLEHKIVVITGGAKGLGYALAEAFVAHNATVVMCDIDEVQLKQAETTLSSSNIATYVLDVTQEKEVNMVTENIIKRFGRIDIWINNAGIWMPNEPVEQINLEKAQQLFQINVFGYVHGMRAAAPCMKLQQSGSIINIISTTAFDGMNGSSGSIYVASKYALRGLTNAVRDELKEGSLQVFAVYPGGMKTDIFNEKKPEQIDQFMSPESVALKIVENLELENPVMDLILTRPGQIFSKHDLAPDARSEVVSETK
jgi:3-oxoacyl-[acyl-carrier protein] reductase